MQTLRNYWTCTAGALGVIALLGMCPSFASASDNTVQVLVPISLADTVSFPEGTVVGSAAAGIIAPSNRQFPWPLPHPRRPYLAALSAAHVASGELPKPAGNPIARNNPGFTGFPGLTHLDQWNAGTGKYKDTQFSLEPPDQALCVGNGFVFEAVNSGFAVDDIAGNRLSGPAATVQFLHLQPNVSASTGLYGDFTTDPKCYFDPRTKRFFLTVLDLPLDPVSGAFVPRSHLYIAVSKSGDPRGMWNIFAVDVTNDGLNGTPAHLNCPCFGDQPHIGADATGFYVSTDEFDIAGSAFNGAQIYAFSKAALVAGKSSTAVMLSVGPLEEGTSYTVQPAAVPPGGAFESAAGGTEYFLSALDFTNTTDDRIAVWALSNTRSLSTATPTLRLSHAIVQTEVYGHPPASEQKPGPTPLGDSISDHPLAMLDSGDSRTHQVMYAGGRLWSAVNTVVQQPKSPVRAGIAWFAVTPSVSATGQVSGGIAGQGYVSVNGENVIYPSIAVNNSGKAAMTFTLVGPDFFPSAAYTLLDLDARAGPGRVHVAAAGANPEDGVTGYPAFGGDVNHVARWGDYSAATVDESGAIWMAVEFIPNAPRSYYANWGTFVMQLTP